MSFFISIEGFDGTGKSTQASILKKNLDDLNIDSILVREPGSTSFSEKIREILKEQNTKLRSAKGYSASHPVVSRKPLTGFGDMYQFGEENFQFHQQTELDVPSCKSDLNLLRFFPIRF